MPRSSAVRIVLTASSSSLPPHIHPPIAHVPSAMLELTIAVPQMTFSSISGSEAEQIAQPPALRGHAHRDVETFRRGAAVATLGRRDVQHERREVLQHDVLGPKGAEGRDGLDIAVAAVTH